MITAGQISNERYITVSPSTSVGSAVSQMLDENVSVLLVIGVDQQLVGTVSDQVLLRAAIDSHLRQDPVSLHMKRQFAVVSEQAPLDVVLDQFVLHDLQFLAVAHNHGMVQGIIGRLDLLKTVFGEKPSVLS